LNNKSGKKTKRATPDQQKKDSPTKTLNSRTVSFDPNTHVIAAVLLKWRWAIAVSDDVKLLSGNSP
jgi:hypothetical protein